ncbi:MAG TPA: hypothetical protein VKC65_03805 [Gaiellaceae bacterium]|nr:hypothetical protein [Gaiellaceae bacterium]
MRKTVLLVLLALLIPAAAQSQSAAPQNGTLSIREGIGVVQLDARGSMTGRANGKITITDPKPYDSKRAVVYGATKTTYKNVKTTLYQGKNLRFRLIGARFNLRIQGRSIFLSAIARGDGYIDGAGDPAANLFYDGVWSLNDSAPQSLPNTWSPFDLGPPSPQ